MKNAYRIFKWESLVKRYHYKDTDVGMRIILK
jgi:hypothetical protein